MDISSIGGGMELIKRIKSKITKFSNDVVVGIGDDAAVLKFDKNRYMLMTTDMLVENDHFSLKWSTPKQIGKKSMECNVSDIAVMGGIPKYALISLSLPKGIPLEFVDGFYNGIREVAKRYRIDIIGGDTTHSDEVVVNIAMVGFVEKEFLALRSKAKPGELIFVSGDIGKSTAGLELLRGNEKGKSIKPHLEPKCQLDLARKLVKLGVKTMEDVSDGLASEVKNICNASGTGANIYLDKIPLSKNTVEDARKVGKEPHNLALYGGEDFEIVFTIAKKLVKKLKGLDVTMVGEITPKKEGIWLIDKGKKLPLGKGFDHFSEIL